MEGAGFGGRKGGEKFMMHDNLETLCFHTYLTNFRSFSYNFPTFIFEIQKERSLGEEVISTLE